MMPLIQTPDDVARLREIAGRWVGTPYAPGGCVHGPQGGIACHMVPSVILREFGHKAPIAPPRGGLLKSQIVGFMVEWLNSYPEHFRKVEEILPGDVVVMAIPYGHLTLALDKSEIIHVWQGTGVHFTNFSALSFRYELRGIWRPIK